MEYRKRQRLIQSNYRSYFDNQFFQSFLGDGFSNWGYWSRSTIVGEQGNNLVDRLLKLLPSTEGKILDVACGQGGTTRRLTAHFPASNITAINLFEDQLTAARKLAPDCTFVLMDAVDLAFLEEQFDVVCCVEAAHHFETREDFLRESWRVLKPGGYLVLAEILFTVAGEEWPRENVVTLGEYEEQLKSVGYPESTIICARNQTWTPFRRQFVRHHVKAGRWITAAWVWGTLKKSTRLSQSTYSCARKNQYKRAVSGDARPIADP